MTSAVPLTAGINSPGPASSVWISLPNQTLMKSIVSLGASFVTSQPSRLANRSLALPLPSLTSGKKTHPRFSSGSPFLSAGWARPSSQIPAAYQVKCRFAVVESPACFPVGISQIPLLEWLQGGEILKQLESLDSVGIGKAAVLVLIRRLHSLLAQD